MRLGARSFKDMPCLLAENVPWLSEMSRLYVFGISGRLCVFPEMPEMPKTDWTFPDERQKS